MIDYTTVYIVYDTKDTRSKLVLIIMGISAYLVLGQNLTVRIDLTDPISDSEDKFATYV